MKKLFLFALLLRTCNPCPAQIDTNEYLPGFPNFSAMPTQIDQLNQFPPPRYKDGHGLMPNFNGADPIYFSGYQMPGTPDVVVRENGKIIQSTLCTKFNYMYALFWGAGAFNDSSVAMVNKHPEWKVSIMTLRSQTNTKIWNQSLPNVNYLQDAQGRFLNNEGNVTGAGDKKWRATAPVSDYISDGIYVRNDKINPSLAGLTRDVNLVCENDEVYPITLPSALRKDPVCNAAINASPFVGNGIFTEGLWFASMIAKNDKAYRDQFMSHPRLQNAIYTEYRLDGNKGYAYNWDEIRKVMDKINGQYYADGDFYTRFPYNWKDWTSAWHGLKWVTQSRYWELKAGDKLFSPWIGAGWECDLSANVLSAQWLGLLKVLGMYGAEFYYTGYFNEAGSLCAGVTTPNDPKGYAYQMAIPSYAQAITSRYEDILRNGTLLPGDMVDNSNPIEPSPLYQFNTGVENKVVVIRKKDDVYAITATYQNYDNIKGSTPINSTATFTLAGNNYQINIRRQGSTYILDLTDIGDPVFYQLDGWHEASHPYRWSKDISIEAENYESSTGKRRTYFTSYPNLSQFMTFVMLSAGQTASYNIETTNAGQKYLFVKGESTGDVQATFDGNTQTLPNLNGWNRISLSTVSAGSHTINLKALGSSEIDSICVTDNINKYPISTTPSCTYTYSAWSVCNNGTQTRTVLSAEPAGCSGVPVVSQTCQMPSCVAPADIIVTAGKLNVLAGWTEPEICNGYQINIRAIDGKNTIEKIYDNPDFTGGTFTGLFKNRDYIITIGTICPDNSVVKSAEIPFKTTR